MMCAACAPALGDGYRHSPNPRLWRLTATDLEQLLVEDLQLLQQGGLALLQPVDLGHHLVQPRLHLLQLRRCRTMSDLRSMVLLTSLPASVQQSSSYPTNADRDSATCSTAHRLQIEGGAHTAVGLALRLLGAGDLQAPHHLRDAVAHVRRVLLQNRHTSHGRGGDACECLGRLRLVQAPYQLVKSNALVIKARSSEPVHILKVRSTRSLMLAFGMCPPCRRTYGTPAAGRRVL